MKLKRLLYLILLALMVVSCGKDDAPKPPTDTNTAPTIEGKTFMVDEDIDDAVVIGTVSAQDDDNDPLEFSIATNNDDLFEIGKTDGKLSLISGKSLDYAAKQQHTITVSVTDGTDSAQATVTINVISTDPIPQMEDQSFEVAENIGDTDVIGAVDATDEDTLEFSITDDASGLFEIDMATGEISLKAGEGLDFETAEQHTFTVSVTDNVNNPVEAQITITVTDVPEAQPNDKNAFVTTWETTNNNQIVYIGMNTEITYTFQINWGDGSTNNITDFIGAAAIKHVYATAGTYTVSIAGDFPAIFMGFVAATPLALKSIEQWGTIQWQTMEGAFQGCENMVYNATDAPELSQVESMKGMFFDCHVFNGDLNDWNVLNVITMRSMFRGCSSFNADISGWQTNNVLDMGNMFYEATAFNQDIRQWDVGKVEDMSFMFFNCMNFNVNLGGWDIENVNNMSAMLTDSGLSMENYGNTLITWASKVSTPTNISFGANGLEYCGQEAIDARNELINTYGWQIFGDSQCQ